MKFSCLQQVSVNNNTVLTRVILKHSVSEPEPHGAARSRILMMRLRNTASTYLYIIMGQPSYAQYLAHFLRYSFMKVWSPFFILLDRN
jgi:hypothetical protein